jgi:type II secretory pathway pseudopilin PulG
VRIYSDLLARMREKILKYNSDSIRKLKKRIGLLKNGTGFTLVELTIVTSVIVILLGFISISLVSSQQGASLTSVEEILLADLKQQQLKAMIGDTEGRADPDPYGIHFDSNQYVLFHGTYSAGEASNSVINLDSNMQFNSPDFNVIFNKVSGEIPSTVVIELQDNTNSKLKRIYLNTLGVITQVESL